MRRKTITIWWLLWAAGCLAGQTQSLVGTITGIKPEAAEIEVKPDRVELVKCRFTPDTIAQRIAPGETDLKKAVAISVTDVASGDRVLLTLEAGSGNVRRIVVMSANDIARKNDAERLDWQKRGLTGIVISKSGSEIRLKLHTIWFWPMPTC